jgi:hypothetical protein
LGGNLQKWSVVISVFLHTQMDFVVCSWQNNFVLMEDKRASWRYNVLIVKLAKKSASTSTKPSTAARKSLMSQCVGRRAALVAPGVQKSKVS